MYSQFTIYNFENKTKLSKHFSLHILNYILILIYLNINLQSKNTTDNAQKSVK